MFDVPGRDVPKISGVLFVGLGIWGSLILIGGRVQTGTRTSGSSVIGSCSSCVTIMAIISILLVLIYTCIIVIIY